jgi:hypothetical protein
MHATSRSRADNAVKLAKLRGPPNLAALLAYAADHGQDFNLHGSNSKLQPIQVEV